jgi:ribosomal subunit interface protein
MQTPIQITFRHMPPSEALRARVLELLDRLERFSGRVMSCQVVVEAPPRHQKYGAPFEVKVDLQLPGHDLHVHSGEQTTAGHADVYTAVRDVFDTLKRKLQQLRPIN